MPNRICIAVVLAAACGSAHRAAPDASSSAPDASRALPGDAAAAIGDGAGDAASLTVDAAAPDPCAGVVCNSPPAPTCSDSATLVTYSAGTCSGGTCSYAATSQTCDSGCYGTACVTSATDACGVCDRDWQCDAALDHWASIVDSSGLGCMDQRTGTTLRCSGEFDNPSEDSYDQGTWSTTYWGMELVFVGINGFPDVDVDCYPP